MEVLIMSDYYIKYEQFINGVITKDEWYQYCYSILSDIMEQNRDVFIRMKNEWSGV